jgi:HPt (histidine-containing phosphotransfer) domain-containing protein
MVYTLKVINHKQEDFSFLKNNFIIYYQDDEFLYDLLLDIEEKKILSASNNLLAVFSQFEDITEALEKALENLKTEDINHQRALDMLAGSETLLKRSKELYFTNYSTLEDELLELDRQRDYQSISSLLHKIKGFSLYLGSQRLYDTIIMIEDEIADGNYKVDNIMYFIRLHQRILKYCQE